MTMRKERKLCFNTTILQESFSPQAVRLFNFILKNRYNNYRGMASLLTYGLVCICGSY